MPLSAPRIVMKFGGTSVADLDRIRNVAKTVKKQVDAGCEVTVVVSAMSGVTNQLVGYCESLNPLFDPCEYDSIVATGEQVTSGLLAIALQNLGVQSRSWAGWQIPILTDDAHSKARIQSIDSSKLIECMQSGVVPVVAGFQGVDENGRVATLGRGGSDTSAVALAASMQATRCDIYTDVDGIYTTDPRIVKKAKRIPAIAYEEMLELASVGAKVLQTRSVELAMKEQVRVQVLSSFDDNPAPMENSLPGSLVVSEDEIMEKEQVTGIAYSLNEAKVVIKDIPDHPGIAASVFAPLARENVNVDMIVQSSGSNQKTDMTFTVPKTDLLNVQQILEREKEKIGFAEMLTDDDVVKISVVGIGMRSHTGVANTMFKTLAERSINVQVISTSEIKVSVLVAAEYVELAVRALHTAYGLDAQ
ncbi:Aspartate kinase (MetL1) (PDB:2CDQ) [Commensalibacter communis]|uniref:Aspartokinase n=1 Tax=Commensalibacter communis TaxID=2972786 RepID=A0A9W4TQK8_9PROT|nr:aspartate kinase [Commensalibacter communis]CAI3954280.1 Aspartate kinase (MetL1) (PDB:2CDQ) [Commensalibacter communis]CAI3955858.1 Aspartate kinase (MetL1) (PDB:2CDQ) [Commensalibacter communis]CAI3956228.1 Aspartate kinase (MetL1) (PDB:2CDQ) [Commensalibacter communis]CAI3957434.1 Aspartate kinase (MetL1) (PDB:2CDQ) [Commensalibacter communis]CAI3957807.1 Aspartate kinase (MetL1) (PDB:2CDQ) [Commensalibacter communis]